MKSKFYCAMLAVAAIVVQLGAVTDSAAQTYQDILKQVATPGYVDSNHASPVPDNNLPTLDTVFQDQAPDASASQVPSAVVENNPANGSPTQPAATLQYDQNGQVCNPGPGNCATGAVVMQPGNIYSPTYTAPIYTPGQNLGAVNSAAAPGCGTVANAVEASCGDAAANSGRNFVFGVYGLVFDRDYEDDVFLVRNAAGDTLRSTDADVGNLGGLEFFLGTRNCDGRGLDLRYWGLFTNQADYTLAGASFTSYIPDLANVTWPGNGRTIEDVINGSTSHNIHRDNEIHNVELNMLRNAGCFKTRRGRIANYELLAGFRWFEFAEEFHWDVNSPTAPTMLFFDHNVQNTLLGFQIGGLTEVCLSEKLRLNAGTKLGIFNNRVRAEQILQNELGQYASVDGSDYFFRNSKNDLSMLGELNLALAYHYNPCSRLTIGYRALGVSGIALAPNQLNNFNYVAAITNLQSNADLLMHGSFFGFEFCR